MSFSIMAKGSYHSVLYKETEETAMTMTMSKCGDQISQAFIDQKLVFLRDRIFLILQTLQEAVDMGGEEEDEFMTFPRRVTSFYSQGSHSMGTLTGDRAFLCDSVKDLAYCISTLPSRMTSKEEQRYARDWSTIRLVRQQILSKLMQMEVADPDDTRGGDITTVSRWRPLADVAGEELLPAIRSIATLRSERARLFKLVQGMICSVPVPRGWETLSVVSQAYTDPC
jgi:hypothetical protein